MRRSLNAQIGAFQVSACRSGQGSFTVLFSVLAGTEIRVLGTELFLAEKFANKVWLFQEAFVLSFTNQTGNAGFPTKIKTKR